MQRHPLRISLALALGFSASTLDLRAADRLAELRVGRAGHAFDHLGSLGEQAEAAAASGATIIYATGLGPFGYQGLPHESSLVAERQRASEYNRRAKQLGVKLSLGYVCATSLVKLDEFDKNWSPEFRRQFKTQPAQWLQQDRQGRALPSWYGGDYRPACMNNPDWRAYQRFMVRQQLETGHDGIFFDNPTVHPQGCYCSHCMKSFARFLETSGAKPRVESLDFESLRSVAEARPGDFLRFRATVARDFLAEMRRYARTIDPDALVTCNNSLNSPSALFSQCRAYGYDINQLSKSEDFVVVEDMVSQPRVEPDGTPVEYGPTYKQLHALSHGKPVVAVTLAGGDYHTPPSLMRLAMAEAAAHGASYLSWPTWPEDQRARMTAAVRAQADFLRQNEDLLNDATPRADVTLFLPFHRWTETVDCQASALAAALSRANVQYDVMTEENFHWPSTTDRRRLVVVESDAVLPSDQQVEKDDFLRGGAVVSAENPQWMERVQDLARPSVVVDGPPTVRAVAWDQPQRTIIHLYNLNIQRLSSFEDKVTPAENIRVTASTALRRITSVTHCTADDDAATLAHAVSRKNGESRVELTFPRLDISAIVVIEGEK